MKRYCPIFERETSSKIIDVAPVPWVVRECQETGMVFLENPPGYESLKSEFAWEVTYEKEAAKRRTSEPMLQSLSAATKSFRRKVLKRQKIADKVVFLVQRSESQNINLLDLGCGEGTLLGTVMNRVAKKLASRCRPHGIEISNELARRADDQLKQSGGRCVHANALDGLSRFDNQFFDLIIMSSFLEHEIYPLSLLREAFRCLRNEGHILIKVPNYASWNRIVRGTRWCGYRWPDHVNYFTPTTLKKIATEAGFSDIHMGYLDKFPLSDSLYAKLTKS
jgi:SAM-dependent methyltransferase